MDSNAVDAVIKFAVKFCEALEKDKSVVSSPLSAEYLLALLTLGSTDPAHSEILASLGLADDDSIRSSFSAVSSKLRDIKGVTLNVANKVYIQDGIYDLQPQLKEDAVKIFDAAIEKVDFGDSASAAKTINEWVENKTENKIKNIMSADSVDSSTCVVLVNAIYFKGTWKDTFNPSATKEQPFNINEQATVNVPMMYREFRYILGFSEKLQAQLLELPYIGEESSMLIVLPSQIEGLNPLMAELATGHDLLSDLRTMSKTIVKVTIPKFKIETTIDLKKLLSKLGIKAIFDKRNSGITKLLNTEEPLYVSDAVQKAIIEVNEEGAEAAAAIRMLIKKKSGKHDHEFRADRPFLYLLLGADRLPLFIGVYRGIP